MCGGRPQAPQVVYQGPSQEQLAAQQASLDQYRTQMNDQQTAFKTQLQAQIDAANAETSSIRSRYEKELAASTRSSSPTAAAPSTANAQAETQQMGVYAVTATTSDAAPTGAQTTAAVTKKDKSKKSLRISTGGTPADAGAGLNIGV